MASRIFWVLAAGLALVTGMVLQDGGSMFGWDDRSIDASVDRAVDRSVDRTVDRTVDRVVDRTLDQVQVVSADGQDLDVTPETRRAMADAVGRLVKAEAELAVLRIGNSDSRALQAASTRRAQARADVERLKAEIKGQEQAARLEQDAIREQVQREVRDNVRETVREAVRN